jgi:hypothetical protein
MIVSMREDQQARLSIALFANPLPGEAQNQPANAGGVPVWTLAQDFGGSVLTPNADGLGALFVPGPIAAGQSSAQATVSVVANGIIGATVPNVTENFIITVNALSVEIIRSSFILELKPGL